MTGRRARVHGLAITIFNDLDTPLVKYLDKPVSAYVPYDQGGAH